MPDVDLTLRGPITTAIGQTAPAVGASRSDTEVGDYLLVVADVDYQNPADLQIASSAGVVDLAGAAGWTEVAAASHANLDVKAWLGKVTTGGARTVTVNQASGNPSDVYAHIYTLNPSGGDVTVDGTPSANTDTSSPFTHGAVTVAGTKSLLVCAHGQVQFTGTGTNYGTAPSGMTEGADTALGHGFSGMQSCYQVLASAGSTGTRDQTSAPTTVSSGGGAGLMVALRSQGASAVTHQGAAALSSSSTLTVAAYRTQRISQPIGAFDTLTVGAVRHAQVAAPLSAAGSLSAGATRAAAVTAPLVETNTLAVGADRTARVAASLTAADTLTVGARQHHLDTAADLAAADTLTVGASRAAHVAAPLTGTDTLAVAARQTHRSTVALAAADSLTTTAGQALAASLAAADTLAVADPVYQGYAAAATLTGADTLTAGAAQTHRIGAALAAADTLAVAGTRGHPAAVDLTADDELDISGTRVKIGAATLTGTDTLDVGYILRTAVVAASLAASDTVEVTAAASGGGGLNISVWAVDRAQGNRLVPLPGVVSGDVSDIANEPGAVSITHSASADPRGAALLRRDVGDDSDLEVEIWLGGRRSTALRGYLDSVEGDDVAENGARSYSGSLMLIRLDQAVIAPQPADEKREYRVAAATPGEMALQLLAQVQAGGFLTDIATDFTATHDSDGVPWPELFTGKWSPGTSLLAWVQSLVELALCETELTAGKVWRLFVFGGRGIARTAGLSPVTLRRGLNVGEAGRRATVRGAGTDFLVAAGEGNYRSETVPNARARRGRAVAVATSVGQIDQPDALAAAAQRVASSGTTGAEERSFGLSLTAGQPRPVQSFLVGDTVRVDTDGTLTSERVAQWQIGWDPSGITGSAMTGDLIRSRMAGLLRRLNAVGSGTTIIGTSEPTEDTGVPLAPTGLVVGSAAFVEGQDVYAAVTAGWQAVQSNTDGTAATDLDSYRVEYAFETAPTAWQFGADVESSRTSASFPVAPRTLIRVRVRAKDRAGNVSAWSTEVAHLTEDDSTPPPVASAPVVQDWMGALRITWDGNTTAGLDERIAAPDFSHVELHLSPASNFTPDVRAWPVGTLVTNLYAGGTWTMGSLPIGVTQYARLVAVDLRGNRAAPSVQGLAAPRQLLGPEIFDGAVGSAKIADLAVKTAKIDNLAVNNAKIADLSVAKLTAGTMSADVIVAGIFRTALTGSRAEFDNAGLRLYDPSGAVRVNLASATGNALVTGEYRTAMSGARMVFNPLGSNPAESRWYPTDGVRYSRMKPSTSVAVGFEGQGGITMKAYSARGDGLSGEVSAFPSYASVAAANEMDGGGVLSRLAATLENAFIGGPKVDISYGADQYCQIGRAIDNAYIPRTVVRLGPRDGDGNAAVGVWDRHSYVQFDTGVVSVVNDTVLINIQANAFVVGSERRTKTAIEAAPFDPREIVRGADWYRYEKLGALVDGAPNPPQLGLMVDELPPELLVHNPDQDLWGVDVYGALAVLWGVARQQDAELAELRARLGDRPKVVRAA